MYRRPRADTPGIDLDAEVEREIVKNAARVYERDAHSTTRVAEGADLPNRM